MESTQREAFGGVFRNRRVLVTGHTGFKGSWLSLWLGELGAIVSGFARAPHTNPSHYELLDLKIDETIGEIADREAVIRHFEAFQPEVVFHLAAQPIVRESYRIPAETFLTNVVGSVNVCEACRATSSVRAVVVITTDKVYHNREWTWGYRENDRLGGTDPYSASKACVELALESYRSSFWPLERFGKDHGTLLSTVRAGNVVGGGDWAKDRLIPDLMRAAASGQAAEIRAPESTRPWQHVLEPLSGYLLVARGLLEGRRELARSWNFGPSEESTLTVRDVVALMKRQWHSVQTEENRAEAVKLHEATLLKLDSSLAREHLGWKPVWNAETTVELTADWYRHFHELGELRTRAQIHQYLEAARAAGLAGVL